MKKEKSIDDVESKNHVTEEKEGCLEPSIGAAYRHFKRESVVPGTPSFLAHMLLSEFDEDKKEEAEDLMSRTLAPADLLTYLFQRAEHDPEVKNIFKEEVRKRLAKKSAFES